MGKMQFNLYGNNSIKGEAMSEYKLCFDRIEQRLNLSTAYKRGYLMKK